MFLIIKIDDKKVRKILISLRLNFKWRRKKENFKKNSRLNFT